MGLFAAGQALIRQDDAMFLSTMGLVCMTCVQQTQEIEICYQCGSPKTDALTDVVLLFRFDNTTLHLCPCVVWVPKKLWSLV